MMIYEVQGLCCGCADAEGAADCQKNRRRSHFEADLVVVIPRRARPLWQPGQPGE